MKTNAVCCPMTAGTGTSTAQGTSHSPFNDYAVQNGMPNQQGSQLQSQLSIVSQTSGFAQQQPSSQPPFLVQYGNSNNNNTSQGQCSVLLLYLSCVAAAPVWNNHNRNSHSSQRQSHTSLLRLLCAAAAPICARRNKIAFRVDLMPL